MESNTNYKLLAHILASKIRENGYKLSSEDGIRRLYYSDFCFGVLKTREKKILGIPFQIRSKLLGSVYAYDNELRIEVYGEEGLEEIMGFIGELKVFNLSLDLRKFPDERFEKLFDTNILEWY